MKTKDNNSYVPMVGRNWRIIDYRDAAFEFLKQKADDLVVSLGWNGKQTHTMDWLTNWSKCYKEALATKEACDKRRAAYFGSSKKDDCLCSGDCNECETIQNPQLALLMNVLAKVYGRGVCAVVNAVCPNMTCCPRCHIDDFCHFGKDGNYHYTDEKFAADCDIERKARRIAKQFIEAKDY